MMGNELVVPFPTFTQTPACGYPLVHTKVYSVTTAATIYYPASTAYTDADANPAISNLANIVDFDIANE